MARKRREPNTPPESMSPPAEEHDDDRDRAGEQPPPDDAGAAPEGRDAVEPEGEDDGEKETMADAMRGGLAETFGQASDSGEAGEPGEGEEGDEPGEGAPAKKAGEAEEEGADDPDKARREQEALDAELEKQLSERGRKRFSELKETTKQLEERASQAEQQVTVLRDAWSDAGLTGEQFPEFLRFARAYNSEDPREVTQAVQMTQAHAGALVERMIRSNDTHGLRQVGQQIDEMRRYIALQLGEDPGAGSAPAAAGAGQQPGAPRAAPNPADPLAGHPDLLAEVENLDITRERALEIARYRESQRRSAADEQRLAERHRQQTQAQQFEQRRQTAVQQIATLEKQWSENDLDFGRKQAELMRRAEAIWSLHPPEEWAQRLADEYQALSQLVQPPPDERPRRRGAAPLSPGAARGSGSGTPASMSEAMRRGVEAYNDPT